MYFTGDYAYKGESEELYLWKLGQAKDQGIIMVSWEDIADQMNKIFRKDESEYRTETAYRKPYQQAKKFYEKGVFSNFSEEDYIKELREAQNELKREKCKIQTEKLELNRWHREMARDELIAERIEKAVKDLEKYPLPEFKPLCEQYPSKNWLLAFGDSHYGVEFKVPDLYGNFINEYSPEIFEERMALLFSEVINLIENNHITHLHIWEMGDAIDGILRLTSQLMKLRFGILDSSIIYGNILGKWLTDLSEYVDITFQMVKDSNHNQLRICNAPKNAFPEENVSKVIMAVIEARTSANPRIKILKNATGFNFANISGYNVLGVHGELKNIVKSVGDFTVAYNTPINYIIGAHVHHPKEEEVGIDYECITIPSIIGVDPYGMSLVKTSRAGAKLIGFTEYKGKTTEETIRLN